MEQDQSVAADRILEEALESTGARDPREFYRARLKELRSADPAAYESAVAYYRDTLIPTVASGAAPALDAWTEYGRRLAEALTPGRTVSIDGSGRSSAFERPGPDVLVLHLPDDNGARALLVSLPLELSAAQRATYDVLVAGKQRPSQSSTK